MKILRLSASNAKYGGNVYEELISDVLSDEFDISSYSAMPGYDGFLKYLLFPVFYFRVLFKSIFNRADIVIQPLESVLWLNGSKKNIVVLHHYDPSYSNFLSKCNQYFTFLMLLFNKRKVDRLIVVSQYWKNKMISHGFDNTTIIYNAFDMNIFGTFEKSKIIKDLPSDVVKIYVGNAHRKKGYDKIIEALKDLPVYLISTGYGVDAISYPNVVNYNLSYVEYLSLLGSVDLVITFSQFDEGWCRTAHEALLLGTPVFGSGSGGMQELLLNSNQYIYKDLDCMKQAVKKLSSGALELKNINQSYVNSFSIEMFSLAWFKIIKDFM